MKYDRLSSCNKCGGKNKVIKEFREDWTTHEAKTKCDNCGHADHWAYGYFESRQYGLNKSEKYGFDTNKVKI